MKIITRKPKKTVAPVFEEVQVPLHLPLYEIDKPVKKEEKRAPRRVIDIDL